MGGAPMMAVAATSISAVMARGWIAFVARYLFVAESWPVSLILHVVVSSSLVDIIEHSRGGGVMQSGCQAML